MTEHTTLGTHILRSAFSLHSITDNYHFMTQHQSYQQLVSECDLQYIKLRVRRAKSYLIRSGAKPGEQVLIAHSVWPSYLVWLLACAELALVLVVCEDPIVHQNQQYIKKLLACCYGDIHWVIATTGVAVPDLGQRAVIEPDIIQVYRRETNAEQVWSTPHSVLFRASTSGTTGWPSVTEFSHAQTMQLAYRAARLLQFEPDQVCLHTKILHHGSVLVVHFLPALLSCDQHWHLPHTNHQQFPAQLYAQLIQQQGINQLLCFYQQFQWLAEHLNSETALPGVKISVLGAVQPHHLRTVCDQGAVVRSIWGATECSGPVFAPVLVPDTLDLGKNCGEPLDDFYQISLNSDSELVVHTPWGTDVVTGDYFAQQGSEFVYLGRSTQYKRGGFRLFISELSQALAEILPNVSVDPVYQTQREHLYVRSDVSVDLDLLNNQLQDYFGSDTYRIDLVVVADRSEFFSGIKFDARYFSEYSDKLPENPKNYQIIYADIQKNPA